MITALTALNRCQSVADIVSLFSKWSSPADCFALYRSDSRSALLRRMGTGGKIPAEWLPFLPEGDSLAWRALYAEEPLSDGKKTAIPIHFSSPFRLCLLLEGDALKTQLLTIQPALVDTILRCIQSDKSAWLGSILSGLGGLSQDGLIVATMDGDLVFYGDGLVRCVGWTAEDVREKGWTNLVYPDPVYRVEVMKGLAALLHGKGSNGVVRRLTCKDGTEIEMAIWSALGPGIHGGQPTLLGVLQDVTHSRKEAREIARSESLERLGRLSGTIAHDFNNLLCSIMGHADLLRMQTGEPASIEKRSRTILEACERGAALTRQLLALGGTTNTVKKAINPAREIEQIVALFAGKLPSGLRVDFQELGEKAIIEADPALLSSAVLNLLVNAKDATGRIGWIRISVDCQPMPAKLAYKATGAPQSGVQCVMVTVQDSGPGFSADALIHLLEPFYSTKSLGHGLGLSAVVGFLDTHAGALSVENIDGACVRLCFPISDRPEDQLDALVAEAQGEGQMIWLVDDDSHVLEFASLALAASGYGVRAFRTGQEACMAAHECVLKDRPQLLVLDVVGEPGGSETLLALEAEGVQATTLWVSGYAPEQSVLPTQLDASNFLQKPYTATYLLERVGSMFSRSG
jgi:PAS domain S-box-containing protein